MRPPSGPKGKRSNKSNNAQVAQLVEQLAFNQLVLGSSPSLRTFSKSTRLHQGGFFVLTCQLPLPKKTGARTLSEAPSKGAGETRFDCTSARVSRAYLLIRIPEEEFYKSAESEWTNSIPVCVLSLKPYVRRWMRSTRSQYGSNSCRSRQMAA